MWSVSEQEVFVSYGRAGRTVCLGDRRHALLLLLLLLLSLWPQQDTSSGIMGLCRWLISSFMAHVWALHLYSTCCDDRLIKVGSGELTRLKSTQSSTSWSSIVTLFCSQEALQTPLYWRTHQATCTSCIVTLMSCQNLRFSMGFYSRRWPAFHISDGLKIQIGLKLTVIFISNKSDEYLL